LFYLVSVQCIISAIEQEVLMAEQSNTPSDSSDRTSHFLLVVDSGLENLKYTATLLRRFGYQTYTAARAMDALEIASVKVPSLIITALNLKDMDGLEFIKQIRKDPRTADVRFIALTRQGDMVQEARCFEAGAVDCLASPPSAEQLFRSIQTVVEKTPRMNMRIRTMQPVTVTNVSLNDREGAYTLDLSERGMFVRIAEPAPLNMRLSVQIDIQGQKIPVEAAVLYRHQGDRGPYREPGMGLGFVQIAPTDQESIRKFIVSEVTRGLSPTNA
jgi:CheY-like chemotaxis protein